MGIFEPLYYGGGRYAAITDRKLIASLIGSEIPTTDGDKVDGVIPATTNSLKVTYASTTGAGGVTTLNVEQGWCVVTDTTYITSSTSVTLSSVVIGTDVTFTITEKQDYQVGTEVRVFSNANSANYIDGFITEIIFTASTKTLKVKPTAVSGTAAANDWRIRRVVQDGMYFAGLDGAGNTVTLPVPTPSGSTRNDSVYAVVDSTPYTITNKSANGSSATLTTDVPHGFRVGDTVVVSGVDERFDGSYDITAVTTTSPHTFSYNKSITVTSTAVVPVAYYGVNAYTVTSKAYDASTGVVTLITGTTNHGRIAGEYIRVEGVGREFDGTYELITGTSGATYTLQYYQNRIFKTITTTAITESSLAVARVPFRIVVDLGNANTYVTKNKILLATYTVSGANGTISSLTDARIMSIIGTNTQFIPNSTYMSSYIDNAPGRFRYHLDTNAFSYYTDQWRGFLSVGTTSTTAAAGNHTHTYSAINHTHSGFAVGTLNEDGVPSHTHTVGQVSGLGGGSVVVDYISAPDPVSIGNSNSSNYSNTSPVTGIVLLGNDSPVSVASNFTVETYVMVEASLYCVPSAGNLQVTFSLGVTGDTTNVSQIPQDGEGTHQTGATDGTAFSPANRVTITSTSSNPTNSLYKLNRVFKVGVGVHAFYLHQTVTQTGPGPYSITYNSPVIRAYALPFGVVG